MLVRQAKFQLSGTMLFNAGAALFIITTAGMALRHSFIKEPVPLCSVRYQNAMVYPWTRANGQAFTNVDLQAKLAGFDWGVLDNVRFQAKAPVLSNVAIEVGLPKDGARAPGASGGQSTKKSGVGYTWQPQRVKDATSACLAYNVFLPADIDSGSGISLPGLFGNEDTEPLGDRTPAFTTRMRWRDDGRLDVVNVGPEGVNGIYAVDTQRTKIERGRWTRIEQEIMLNTPGKKDGLLRVWVDGDLKFEQMNVALRQDAAHGLRGVDASVHYSNRGHAWAPSPKDTLVRLSPFEIRWK